MDFALCILSVPPVFLNVFLDSHLCTFDLLSSVMRDMLPAAIDLRIPFGVMFKLCWFRCVSFELFLNTAQRLTESLSGVLYADPKTPLDSPRIEEMRKIAAEF